MEVCWRPPGDGRLRAELGGVTVGKKTNENGRTMDQPRVHAQDPLPAGAVEVAGRDGWGAFRVRRVTPPPPFSRS